MQNFEFETWKIRNKLFKSIVNWFILLILGIALILSYILGNIPIIYLSAPLVILLSYINYFFVKYDYLENIVFNEDTIILFHGKSYQYTEIKSIYIKFDSVKGDILSGIRSIFFIPSKGLDNYVIVSYKNDKKSFRILCKSDKDYLRLKLLGRFLQEKGITVKMKGFNR